MWVAVVAAAVGLTGCTREVDGSAVAAGPLSTTDLRAVLLDADEIDDVLQLSGTEVLDEGDAPDDVTEVDPSACHGLVYIAGEVEYESSGFTAMLWRVAGPGGAGDVVEMVAQLPSVAEADEFVGEQTRMWEGCEGEVITSRDKASGSISQERVTAVKARPHMVIASMDSMSRARPCQYGQHLLQAVSSAVLDVSACSNTVPDPAEAIAAKLVDRLGAG